MYEIKRQAEDFIVEEITPDGETLSINRDYSFRESEGKHLICVLIKRNWDTQLAIKRISKSLRISASRIGFAGTKDKRALTAQRVSLWNMKKEDIESLKLKDIQLIPLYYSEKRIDLGDLKGNHFRIKVYAEKMNEIPEKVPNYFGEQRFGTIRPITHLVGKAIIENDLEKAVKIYTSMHFKEEKEESSEARKKLADDFSWKKALDYFPLHLKYERTMIAHLAENEGDYAGALRKIPKNLLLMFVHAYQSYLFNKYLDYAKSKDFETGPIYGYESMLENNEEKKVLENEGVKLSDFKIKSMPEMSSRGLRRSLFLKPENFRVIEKTGNFFLIDFSLPKGTYATTVIDFLFR